MTMRRTLWIVLLATGTVLGFGSGFAHLYGYGHGRHGHHGYGFYGHDCDHWRAPAAPAPSAAP
jgi:hypothetical protein